MIGKNKNEKQYPENASQSASQPADDQSSTKQPFMELEETPFRPPEAVADDDEKQANTPDSSDASAAAGTNSSAATKPKRPSGEHFWQRFSKKQWIVIAAAAVIVIGGTVAVALLLTSHHKAAPKSHVVQAPMKPAPAKPTTVASTLTGLQVAPDVNQRPVTAVMIENSLDARPQSGLDQAGVVFEAVAEGGITRFVALYQDTQPAYIGPVRSVRPYYLQWLLGFDAAVAHVGGSPEAIQDIGLWHVKNLDQEYNGSYFQRISSRAAPHNVYTSLTNLNALEAKLGYGASNYTGFARKPDAAAKQPNATSIDFTTSGFNYNPHFDYDAATNTYKRSEAGKPHMEIDAAGNQTQIAPKVVIALVMPESLEADGLHSQYGTIGSGQMYVFQDGTLTQGTWTKTASTSQFVFKDANGTVIKLNAGQTWLTALGSTSDVAYK